MTGMIALSVFVWKQLKSSTPLLNLRVFRYPKFRISVILSILMYLLCMGNGTLLPIFSQSIRGYTATAYALATIPGLSLIHISMCIRDRALPDGYNTVIGEGGASLSGGEKQRLSIARAMLKDAPIVILDEATANVDPENEDRLQKAIEALTRNKTIIMIAHRLKTVKNADQILVVDNGQIVQSGTHEQLIGRKAVSYTHLCLRRTRPPRLK